MAAAACRRSHGLMVVVSLLPVPFGEHFQLGGDRNCYGWDWIVALSSTLPLGRRLKDRGDLGRDFSCRPSLVL